MDAPNMLQDWVNRLMLAGAYLWLGFTVGYFFRKWWHGVVLPRYHRTPGED